MKKFIIILALILLNNPICLAEEPISLEFNENCPKLVINDGRLHNPKQTILKETPFLEIPSEKPTGDKISNYPLATKVTLFQKIEQTASSVYNKEIERTDVPSSLLSEQLTKNFKTGPLESLHTWAVVQTTMETTMTEHEHGTTDFNASLINILFDGKLKGGQENFRLMLDTTHQHNRPFMQQLVQDAFIESHRIPHHTILFGNSRTGTGYEGAQSPYTLPFVNRSQISRNLANIRKVGIRVKGDYSLVDYDFGGYSSDTFFSSFMPGAEFDGWVNIKPLGKTDGRYGKLVTGGGIVSGKRNSVDYFVGGAYVGYSYKKFWTRAEYATSDGSNGGSGLTTKRRQGWYVTLGYHLTKKLEILGRYDEFDPDKTVSNNNQREYTAGINYYIKGQALKLILNYVYCQNQSKPDSHRIIFGTQLAI